MNRRVEIFLVLFLLEGWCCWKGQARLQASDDSNEVNDKSSIHRRALQTILKIEKVGNNREPASNYPLSECQGDCDDNGDCGEGLICFERDSNAAVPGCIGGESMSARTDFCIRDPATLSDRPSVSPSISPTDGPTASMSPTQYPTKSAAPSTSPSMPPTPCPSSSPTNAPTPTVVAVGPFQLKLHWTRKSCWTGSGNEIPNCKREVTKWCMQCEGHQCNVGDILWVEPCRDDAPTQQLFQWLPLLTSVTQVARSFPVVEWGQLQMQTEQPSAEWLCLQRRLDTQNHTLQTCDESLPEQWYRGFNSTEPFELEADVFEKVLPNCLTMPHHPRAFEEIIHASCAQSRKDRTNQWKALWPDLDSIARDDEISFNERQYYRIGKERRSPSCSETRRCGMCQGDCDGDEDCNGSLKCYQRGSGNSDKTPPGCYGDGVSRMDYCYAAKGN